MFPHLQRHTYWELVGAAILKTWLHVQKLLQNVVENVFYGGDRPSGFVEEYTTRYHRFRDILFHSAIYLALWAYGA